METIDVWRAANATLSGVTLIILMLDLRVNRNMMNDRRLYMTFALAGLLLASIIASVTRIQKNEPFGYELPIVTASCLWCLIGLWITRHETGHLWKEVKQ